MAKKILRKGGLKIGKDIKAVANKNTSIEVTDGDVTISEIKKEGEFIIGKIIGLEVPVAAYDKATDNDVFVKVLNPDGTISIIKWVEFGFTLLTWIQRIVLLAKDIIREWKAKDL